MTSLSNVDISFFFAASFISCSYIFTDILLLRLLAICGSSGYILGALLTGYDADGMLMILLSSSINLLVNLIQSIKIALDRIPIMVPNNLRGIYYNNFHKMKPKEFLKIYKLANIKIAKKTTSLLRKTNLLKI